MYETKRCVPCCNSQFRVHKLFKIVGETYTVSFLSKRILMFNVRVSESFDIHPEVSTHFVIDGNFRSLSYEFRGILCYFNE